MSNAPGVCPNCGSAGPSATHCLSAPCAPAGYHRIPLEHYQTFKITSVHFKDPNIGLVAGDYVMVGILGRGTYGKVYHALQLPLLMPAALKLLIYEADNAEDQRLIMEKFRDEALSLSRLNHPNIVHLLKYGEFSGTPYLVMEYVPSSHTLEDEMIDQFDGGSGFPFATVEHLASQILAALECAHAQNIVHRDIKPENILLQEIAGDVNFVRLVDFGLAKFVDRRRSTDFIAGTPAYMAPEQLKQENIGPWTDLYAVGLLILEMMVGIRLFESSQFSRDIMVIKQDPSFQPVTFLEDLGIPSVTKAFLRKATAFDVAKRYRSVPEFRQAMRTSFDQLSAMKKQSIVIDELRAAIAEADRAEIEQERSRLATERAALERARGAMERQIEAEVARRVQDRMSLPPAGAPDSGHAQQAAQTLPPKAVALSADAAAAAKIHQVDEILRALESSDSIAPSSRPAAAAVPLASAHTRPRRRWIAWLAVFLAGATLSALTAYLYDRDVIVKTTPTHRPARTGGPAAPLRQGQPRQTTPPTSPSGPRKTVVAPGPQKPPTSPSGPRKTVVAPGPQKPPLPPLVARWPAPTLPTLTPRLPVKIAPRIRQPAPIVRRTILPAPHFANPFRVHVGGPKHDAGHEVRSTADGGYIVAGWTTSFSTNRRAADGLVVRFDAMGRVLWRRTYGGPRSDFFYSIAPAPGGWFVGGGTQNRSAGKTDMWVVKIDHSGQLIWTRTFGGKHDDHAITLASTRDGGVAVVGGTKSKGAGRSDLWLVKLDGNGRTQWARTAGGKGDELGTYVTELKDGTLLVGGYTTSKGAGKRDIWIIKFTASGQVLWQRVFGGPDNDVLNSVHVSPKDGSIWVVGSVGVKNRSDGLILKLSPNGDQLWQRRIGGPREDFFGGLVFQPDQTAILIGASVKPPQRHASCWLVKITGDGETLWERHLPSLRQEQCIHAISSRDGGLVLTGHTRSFGKGKTDLYLVKTHTLAP